MRPLSTVLCPLHPLLLPFSVLRPVLELCMVRPAMVHHMASPVMPGALKPCHCYAPAAPPEAPSATGPPSTQVEAALVRLTMILLLQLLLLSLVRAATSCGVGIVRRVMQRPGAPATPAASAVEPRRFSFVVKPSPAAAPPTPSPPATFKPATIRLI